METLAHVNAKPSDLDLEVFDSFKKYNPEWPTWESLVLAMDTPQRVCDKWYSFYDGYLIARRAYGGKPLIKPSPIEREALLDFDEMCDYIGKKYNLPGGEDWQFHSYGEDPTCKQLTHRYFWDSILKQQFGENNFCYGICECKFSLMKEDYYEDFMKPIIDYFHTEFREYADEDGCLTVSLGRE